MPPLCTSRQSTKMPTYLKFNHHPQKHRIKPIFRRSEKMRNKLYFLFPWLYMVSHIKVDSVQEVEEKYLFFILSYCAFFVLVFCLSPSFLTLPFTFTFCLCVFVHFSLSLWKSLEVEQLVQISTKLDLLRKRRVSKAANCCQYVECSSTMQTLLLRKHCKWHNGPEG